jgi:hypothetical protein
MSFDVSSSVFIWNSVFEVNILNAYIALYVLLGDAFWSSRVPVCVCGITVDFLLGSKGAKICTF